MSYHTSEKAPSVASTRRGRAGQSDSNSLQERVTGPVVPTSVNCNERPTAHQKLERKRATDRAAQREHRRRQKTYIMELEAQLQMLRSGNSEDNVARLAEENIRLRQEVTCLKIFVRGVKGLMMDLDEVGEKGEQPQTPAQGDSPPNYPRDDQLHVSETVNSPKPRGASLSNDGARSTVTEKTMASDQDLEKPQRDEPIHTSAGNRSSDHRGLFAHPSNRQGDYGQFAIDIDDGVPSALPTSSATGEGSFLDQHLPQMAIDNQPSHGNVIGEDASSSLSSFYRAFSESYATVNPSSYDFLTSESKDVPNIFENAIYFQDNNSPTGWVDPTYASNILGLFDIFNDSFSMPRRIGLDESSELQAQFKSMDGFDQSNSLQPTNAAPYYDQNATQLTASSPPIYQHVPKIEWPPAPQDRDAHDMLDKARSYSHFRKMLFSAPTLSDFLFDNPSNVLSQDVKFLLEPIRRSKETAEFLATYWVIYLLLRWLILQTEESYNIIPPWFRPTKLQREVKHSIGIDLIAWPTLRDKLIKLSATQPEKINSITKEIGTYLEVNLAGCSTSLNGQDQTLHNAICDLRNWKLQEDFFLLYPEWQSVQEDAIAEFYH